MRELSVSFTKVADKLLLSALAMALIAGCSKPTESENAAIPIVEKNIAAKGGLEAWRGTKSLVTTGQMDAGKVRSPEAIKAAMESSAASGGVRRAPVATAKAGDSANNVVQLPFVLEQARPLKTRLELTFQGQKAVQVYDGKHGWKLRPFLGRHEAENYTADELKLASNEQELDGPLIDYDRKDNKVELDGSEQVEGRDAFKLKVTLPNKEIRHVWIDKETYLDVKIDGIRKMDGKPRAMTTYFRDYKDVNGLKIPHLLETRVEGVAAPERILVEKVQINAKLEDQDFEKPN